jgi:predicted dehydrogenase
MTHPAKITRRSFTSALAMGGLGVPLYARNLLSAPPSGRVRHASFGGDGMAGADVLTLANHPHLELVAVAEVDTARWKRIKDRLPGSKVKFYQDWRKMLDCEAQHLDSVNVGTPDHMHAAMAMSAMQRGLHAYVQKPLAHDLYETRRLAEFAREKKLVTQMGIQIHSTAYYRIGVEVIQSGAIGKVKETHLWSDRTWGDATPVPTKKDPVPSTLNWDAWLGVCAARPYLAGYYHPGQWRKRIDFGTGSLGDMGCHIFDPVFEALGLGAPISVRSDGPAASRTNWALDEVIRYVFPGTRYTAGKTVNFTWYDGKARLPKDVRALLGDVKFPSNGSICIGTQGAMLLPHVGLPVLLPKAQFKDYKLPRNSGTSHQKQFVEAVLGKAKTSAAFDYSGPLTEAVLLGALATRFAHTTLEWDSAALRVTNLPAADACIRRTYRKGWEVKGLS